MEEEKRQRQSESRHHFTANDHQELADVRLMVQQAVARWDDEHVLVRSLWAENWTALFKRWSAREPSGDLVYFSPGYVQTFMDALGRERLRRIRKCLNSEFVKSDEMLSLALVLLDFFTQGMSTSTEAEIAGKRAVAVQDLLDHIKPALGCLLPAFERVHDARLVLSCLRRVGDDE